MTKHIIGQSVYQLIILFIILFDGPNFIKETEPDFINYGFAMKYCFDGPVKVLPEVDYSKILNPEQYLQQNKPEVYLISGLASEFSNADNKTSFFNNTYCIKTFEGKVRLKDAYSIFKSVN